MRYAHVTKLIKCGLCQAVPVKGLSVGLSVSVALCLSLPLSASVCLCLSLFLSALNIWHYYYSTERGKYLHV